MYETVTHVSLHSGQNVCLLHYVDIQQVLSMNHFAFALDVVDCAVYNVTTLILLLDALKYIMCSV